MTEFAYVGTLGALPWLIAALAGMCVRNEAIQAFLQQQPFRGRNRASSATKPAPSSVPATSAVDLPRLPPHKARRRNVAASLRVQAISPYPSQRPLPAPA